MFKEWVECLATVGSALCFTIIFILIVFVCATVCISDILLSFYLAAKIVLVFSLPAGLSMAIAMTLIIFSGSIIVATLLFLGKKFW